MLGPRAPRVRNICRDGDTAMISLVGDVDLEHTPDVHAALVRLSDEQPARLIVDLGEVAYMDSSGVGMLVDVYRRVKGYGGQLILAAVQPRVRGILEITQVDQFFTIHASVDEARQA